MSGCIHCGLCCYYPKSVKGTVTLVRCKHLRGLVGNTHCAIYPNRLFRKVDVGVLCFPRINSVLDYPDCPYNTNKPVSDLHKELYINEINNKNKKL